jgi:hypothetical protein
MHRLYGLLFPITPGHLRPFDGGRPLATCLSRAVGISVNHHIANCLPNNLGLSVQHCNHNTKPTTAKMSGGWNTSWFLSFQPFIGS